MKEREKEIKEAARKPNNPYSHNVCAASLRIVAKEEGYAAANVLIKKYRLDKLFGIHEEMVERGEK